MSTAFAPLGEAPPELETIEVEVRDEVVVVTLNRPDSFNAMNPTMIVELSNVFAWLADRSGARAAVVTGAGKAFSSGGDVHWFKEGMESEGLDASVEVRRGADLLHQGIINLRRAPFPVIAAVNGPAAGAGFSLALACDIRIASREAFFACAYGRIGVSPDGGLTWLLPRAIGPARALELLLNDPNLDAEAAREAGLVSEVVDAGELSERAFEKARKLGAKAPHYVRMCKELIASSQDNTLERHLQLERHGIADSLQTEDVRHAVGAFLSGEEPKFEGR